MPFLFHALAVRVARVRQFGHAVRNTHALTQETKLLFSMLPFRVEMQIDLAEWERVGSSLPLRSHERERIEDRIVAMKQTKKIYIFSFVRSTQTLIIS